LVRLLAQSSNRNLQSDGLYIKTGEAVARWAILPRRITQIENAA
jgi:hypothetical protein